MNAPKATHATKISRSRVFTPHPGFVPSAKMKGSTNPNAMQINSVQSRLHERAAEIVRVAKSSQPALPFQFAALPIPDTTSSASPPAFNRLLNGGRFLTPAGRIGAMRPASRGL